MSAAQPVYIGTDGGATTSKIGGVWGDGTAISTTLLTVLSGRERTVRLLDQIRQEAGDDPAVWLPRLLELA